MRRSVYFLPLLWRNKSYNLKIEHRDKCGTGAKRVGKLVRIVLLSAFIMKKQTFTKERTFLQLIDESSYYSAILIAQGNLLCIPWFSQAVLNVT